MNPNLTKGFAGVDNAANLYCASRRDDWCRTYTLSVLLDRNIKKDVLQTALADTLRRLPLFSTRVGDGLFWSYLEHCDSVPVVMKEEDYPYRPLTPDITQTGSVRVLYRENKISMDGFHGTTDGHGAATFLFTLAGRYLELEGVKTGHNDLVKNVADEPPADELVDSYFSFADGKEELPSDLKENVYRYLPEMRENYAKVTHCLFDVPTLKAAAKKYGLSVSEYLAAVLIYSFIGAEKEPVDKPVIISIPVDLRYFHKSETTANFAFAVPLEYHPHGKKDVKFTEIADAVRGEIKRQATKESLVKFINKNISSQKSAAFVPYFLKKIILRGNYKKNQCSYASVISNLGKPELPEGMKQCVTGACVIAGATPYADFNCAVVTINDVCNLSIASASEKTDVQRILCRFIANDGVKTMVDCNIRRG